MYIISLILIVVALLAAILVVILLFKKFKFGSHIHNKFVKGITVFVLLVIISSTPFIFTTIFNISKHSGFSEWRDGGKGQEYLYIEANNYYDLGYHEGYNLGSQILATEILISAMIPDFNYQYFKTQAKNYVNFISEDYIMEMEGMAKGASVKTGTIITYEDILVQNTFIDIIYGQIYPIIDISGPEIACTALGVKNNDSTLTYGQNFDFPRILNNKGWGEKGYLPGLSFVHTNLTGKAEIFGLRLGGMLSVPCAITSNGLKAFTNVVRTNATGEYKNPISFISRNILETCHNASEVVDIIVGDSVTPKLSMSFNLMIVDATSILGMQCYPNYFQLYYSHFVSTNRYINETSNEFCFSKGNYSLDRQEYVESVLFATLNTTGKFTEQNLIDLLGQRAEGTIPAITREDVSMSSSITLAFLTNEYFGLGNVHDGLGKCPLK